MVQLENHPRPWKVDSNVGGNLDNAFRVEDSEGTMIALIVGDKEVANYMVAAVNAYKPPPIKLKRLENTCTAFPCRWEGETVDGREVVAEVGRSTGCLYVLLGGEVLFSEDDADRMDINRHQLKELVPQIDWLNLAGGET